MSSPATHMRSAGGSRARLLLLITLVTLALVVLLFGLMLTVGRSIGHRVQAWLKSHLARIDLENAMGQVRSSVQ